MKCESYLSYASNIIFKGSQGNNCDDSENAFGNRYDYSVLKVLDIIPGKLFFLKSILVLKWYKKGNEFKYCWVISCEITHHSSVLF